MGKKIQMCKISSIGIDRQLSDEEEKDLKLSVRILKARKREMNKKLHRLESALYYNSLRKEGRDRAAVLEYAEQDEQMLQRAAAYKQLFNGLRGTFFGYPGNLNADSPAVRELRIKESGMYYSNDCGDPYEQTNASMDGKVFEREILRLFYRKFGIDEDTGWGYVTTGGSESNVWGILNGFRKYPNGRLYFCEAAHYSVEKTVLNGEKAVYPYTVIPQASAVSDKIDQGKLMEAVRDNYGKSGTPAILLLTWGTTKFGSVDDVKEITEELRKEGIPYYLHVDAAFFGGIPNNQIEAPVSPTLHELGGDSLSVSLHKFFGVPTINSVVITKDKALGKEISYLGTRDTTISGSRTFPIFSALQRIREILERSPEDYYCKNVRYFEALLQKGHVEFIRDGKSNTFVIACPSEDILKRFQLPWFNGAPGMPDMAHIIVNPFHTKQEMDELAMSIKADQEFHSSTLARKSFSSCVWGA